MFENSTLDGFIGCEIGRCCETPYLQRYTFAGRWHKPDENLFVAAYGRIVEQPLAHVGSEESEIGLVGAIDHCETGIVVIMAERANLIYIGFDDRVFPCYL